VRRAVAATLSVAALGLLASVGGSAAPGFRYGVAAGEVTATSALLWARAGRPGPVQLELARDVGFRRGLVLLETEARLVDDLTVRVEAAGLKPATAYAYRFRQGGSLSAVGRFRTAPAPTASARVRFAVTGDADATPAPGATGPFFNRFGVYERMAVEANDFNVNLGDTIYSDSGVGGVPPAVSATQKWAKYRQNLSVAALARLRTSAALYSHWDDHEFLNDFSREELGEALYRAGVRAFLDYAPVSYTEEEGLYRRFRWGRNLELFFLDERSFRSAKASASGACDGPNGRPDVAPTAPQGLRLLLATIAPGLGGGAPRSCVDRIADPARTMLGARQLARFLDDVRRSAATFKVVLNEVPLQQFYAFPYDRWEGYAAERRQVVEALRAVPNVVVLTTDAHANFVGDVRLATLEAGGPVESGIVEVVTGPVATNTFAREIDSAIGVPGAGRLVSSLLLKPAPPRGIGMRCVAPDVFSYAEVEVTRARLTVTLKDARGRPVQDVAGSACAPVVVEAR